MEYKVWIFDINGVGNVKYGHVNAIAIARDKIAAICQILTLSQEERDAAFVDPRCDILTASPGISKYFTDDARPRLIEVLQKQTPKVFPIEKFAYAVGYEE